MPAAAEQESWDSGGGPEAGKSPDDWSWERTGHQQAGRRPAQMERERLSTDRFATARWCGTDWAAKEAGLNRPTPAVSVKLSQVLRISLRYFDRLCGKQSRQSCEER